MIFFSSKKQIAALLLLSLSFTLFLSCNRSATEGYRVAYIARAQSDSFAAWLADAILKEAEKYDDITVTVFDGQSRNDLIATHIETAIVGQYDAILLQPLDPEAQLAPVYEAIEAGVTVATVNMMLNDDSISAVDANPIQQAAENAKLALTQIPPNGKVVVLLGPAGNMHSIKRREGWQTYFFDERPDVTIQAEQIANWNKDEGMRFMEDWIQSYDQIDAIISMNDNMAVGALEVVKGAGLEKIPYTYGVDGTGEACLSIKEGLMTSTTLQSAYDLAELSLLLIHDLLIGQKEHYIGFITADLITQENVDQYIEMHRDAGTLD